MTFVPLSSTVTDADVVVANFYHVRQGNILPLGGASLIATTAAFDIGSSSYKWNDVYVNNIYAGTITTLAIGSASQVNITGQINANLGIFFPTNSAWNPVESVLSTSGYVRLASGLLIQWGSGVTDPSSIYTPNVTFLTPFVTAFRAFASMRTAILSSEVVGVQGLTSTQMMLISRELTSEVYWVAIGV